MIYLLILIVLLITIFLIKKNILYYKILKLNKKGQINNNDVNLLYDDYYLESSNKKNNKLSCSIGNISNLFQNKYSFDIKMLDLFENMNLLVVSSLNLDLEIEIIKRYPNIKIIAFTNNLLNTRFLSNKIKNIPQITIGYSDSLDIYTQFQNSDLKFDRILVRECLGNINDRNNFFKNMNQLLTKEGFLYIKTFVFDPIDLSSNNKIKQNQILEKQKYLIDYWNYNFSTTQSLINDLKETYQKIKFEEIKLLNLVYLYKITDFIKVLQIYFINMENKISDLNIWSIISTINLLILKVYKDS